MNLPKFVITMDGYFRLGMVNQHKDLLKPGDSCLGGGYYHFDYTSNRIILDRSSYDFGKPRVKGYEICVLFIKKREPHSCVPSVASEQSSSG
jgi:hypothetical protein